MSDILKKLLADVVFPRLLQILRDNPNLTDAEVLALLHADVQTDVAIADAFIALKAAALAE